MDPQDPHAAAQPPYRRVSVVGFRPPLCRRCVRRVSRCVRDVTGVSACQIDPVSGRLSVHGDVEPQALAQALAAAGWTNSSF